MCFSRLIIGFKKSSRALYLSILSPTRIVSHFFFYFILSLSLTLTLSFSLGIPLCGLQWTPRCFRRSLDRIGGSFAQWTRDKRWASVVFFFSLSSPVWQCEAVIPLSFSSNCFLSLPRVSLTFRLVVAYTLGTQFMQRGGNWSSRHVRSTVIVYKSSDDENFSR